MAFDGWRSVLVLGGIRSGKSAYAQSLATAAGPVRDLAGEVPDAEPDRLAKLVAEAGPDQVLLVDDLTAWVTAQLAQGSEALAVAVAELAEAVRGCAGPVVVVSSEVGLSAVREAAPEREVAEAVGMANQAVAGACDGMVLVVAGQPTWLKRPTSRAAVPAAPELPPVVTVTPRQPEIAPVPPPTMARAPVEPADTDPLHEHTLALPALVAGLTIQPGMMLPLPDDEAGERATTRLRGLDVAGAGFGVLADVVRFAAATQRRAVPGPWRSVRVLLVHGDHAGGAAAGESPIEAARRARQTAAGEGGLGALVAETGVGLQLVEAPAARAMETEDALTAVEVDEALTYGWRLAEQAADSGVDLIVIAACGAGSDTAASAVTAALTRAEPVSLLGRVHAPDSRFDDAAWMIRCTAVRDALHRTRARPRNAHDLLAALGGGDMAVVTGVLLGAAARQTPVLLDGPVGVVAGLVSRDIGGQARHWCLLADDGRHPTVRYAADVLGLRPVTDLGLGLGEGSRALAALPLLRAALTVAAALPAHPALSTDATALSTDATGAVETTGPVETAGPDDVTGPLDVTGPAEVTEQIDLPGLGASEPTP